MVERLTGWWRRLRAERNEALRALEDARATEAAGDEHGHLHAHADGVVHAHEHEHGDHEHDHDHASA